jgi:CHASE1-domain containing sensor protein
VSDRWMPILAAIVGLVGGLGGAAIGGSIANEGQEQQFKNQRIADLNNLLNETYSRYLRTSATAYLDRTAGGISRKELIRIQGELEGGAAQVVMLVNDPAVEDAAERLERAVVDDGVDFKTYRTARDAFIKAADASFASEDALLE